MHQCTDLRTSFNGSIVHVVNYSTINEILHHTEKSTLQSLLTSKGTPNSTNIVIGPQLADEGLLYGNSHHFQMYDKLLKSDGVIVIVRYQELDVPKLIMDSVESTQGLFVFSVLFATIISLIVWFVVSIFVYRNLFLRESEFTRLMINEDERYNFARYINTHY